MIKDFREQEADVFAAHLLVPKFLLDRYYKIASIDDLSQLFVVSMPVIKNRIQFEYGNKIDRHQLVNRLNKKEYDDDLTLDIDKSHTMRISLELERQRHNHRLLAKTKDSTAYLFIILQWFVSITFIIYVGYFLYLTARVNPSQEISQTIAEMKHIIIGVSGWIALMINKIIHCNSNNKS